MNARLTPAPATGDLDAFWMPFTANRQFKANPRLLARAEGMYYWTADGREILDGVAGLWCVNAGHGRREITEAVTKQLSTMEYAPAFQMGHPIAFELASRLAKIAPPSLERIFFTNSGSESTMDAIRIARAATGRDDVLKIFGSYHGHHDTVMVSIGVEYDKIGDRRCYPSMASLPDLLKSALQGLPVGLLSPSTTQVVRMLENPMSLPPSVSVTRSVSADSALNWGGLMLP